jgi:hypothetical protein
MLKKLNTCQGIKTFTPPSQLNSALVIQNYYVLTSVESDHLLPLYLSVKRSHYIHHVGLGILMLIQKKKNMDHYIL